MQRFTDLFASRLCKFVLHQILSRFLQENEHLTPPVPIPNEEKKLTEIFIFQFLCSVLKGFMKALKAFIKLFQAPQRSVKIKI